jgi:hypothetical protein
MAIKKDSVQVPWKKEYQQFNDGAHVCVANSRGDWLADLGPEGNPQAELLGELFAALPDLHEMTSKLKFCLARYVGESETAMSTDYSLLKEADDLLTRLSKIKAMRPKGILPILETHVFIDIDPKEVSSETRSFLEENYTMYRDQMDSMREDLLDVNTAVESIDSESDGEKPQKRSVRKEVELLAKTANAYGAAYIRFTSM